ncbi:MAG: hypothetical protein JWO77_994 [Ilumatobacteraceae bacterium]|nr:hypothetical protein [Ilumatobacteraceae bacterium]
MWLPAATLPAAGAGSTGTVSGVVWHDLDGDGRREAGEPGVAHVVVTREGTSTRAETGPDGRWTLTLPAGAVTISAITGWLPSACPGDLRCASGRTPNQRFAVENQFVRAHITITAGRAVTGVDLGLLPDHGDPASSSSSQNSGNDPGDGPALAHDLAARHSAINWYAGCSDPDRTRVCPVGTRLWALGQIYNQGTSEAAGITFVLTVPRGTILSADPKLDPSSPGPVPTRTGRQGSTADGGRWFEFALNRSLPPAGAVWFSSAVRIVGGPSTPRPYTSNRDHESFISINHLTAGDQDAPLRTDPTVGRDGGHNVNWPRWRDDDTSDAIEWNVQ